MKISTLFGHLTATEKRHLCAIFEDSYHAYQLANIKGTTATANMKTYYINRKDDRTYTALISQVDRASSSGVDRHKVEFLTK